MPPFTTYICRSLLFCSLGDSCRKILVIRKQTKLLNFIWSRIFIHMNISVFWGQLPFVWNNSWFVDSLFINFARTIHTNDQHIQFQVWPNCGGNGRNRDHGCQRKNSPLLGDYFFIKLDFRHNCLLWDKLFTNSEKFTTMQAQFVLNFKHQIFSQKFTSHCLIFVLTKMSSWSSIKSQLPKIISRFHRFYTLVEQKCLPCKNLARFV